jgi:hypothetical protein
LPTPLATVCKSIQVDHATPINQCLKIEMLKHMISQNRRLYFNN